jgi:hypothetical protein
MASVEDELDMQNLDIVDSSSDRQHLVHDGWFTGWLAGCITPGPLGWIIGCATLDPIGKLIICGLLGPLEDAFATTHLLVEWHLSASYLAQFALVVTTDTSPLASSLKRFLYAHTCSRDDQRMDWTLPSCREHHLYSPSIYILQGSWAWRSFGHHGASHSTTDSNNWFEWLGEVHPPPPHTHTQLYYSNNWFEWLGGPLPPPPQIHTHSWTSLTGWAGAGWYWTWSTL